MDRFINLLFPKLSIDEVLYKKAPTDTLRAFVTQLQGRLLRMEIIIVSAAILPYVPIDRF